MLERNIMGDWILLPPFEAHIEITLCARRFFARSITKYALYLGRNGGMSASVTKLRMGARGR